MADEIVQRLWWIRCSLGTCQPHSFIGRQRRSNLPETLPCGPFRRAAPEPEPQERTLEHARDVAEPEPETEPAGAAGAQGIRS